MNGEGGGGEHAGEAGPELAVLEVDAPPDVGEWAGAGGDRLAWEKEHKSRIIGRVRICLYLFFTTMSSSLLRIAARRPYRLLLLRPALTRPTGLHSSARRHALSKFAMPAMSPTMTEGGIASWKKNEGDAFAVGDVLLEIVQLLLLPKQHLLTPFAGNRQGLHRRRGAGRWYPCQNHCMQPILFSLLFLMSPKAPGGAKNIAVGTPIAILAEEGDDLSGAAQMAAEALSASPAPAQEPSEPAPPAQPSPTPSPAQPQAQDARPEIPKGDRIFASPIAKKIALEKGIPLSKIKGTGPDGRILRDDVERYQPPAPSTSSAVSADAPASPDYIDIPVTNMRKVIGTRLTESKQQIPHYYLTVEINMDKVLKLREVFNKSLGDKDKAAKLSVNDFVLKAVACALKDVPEANSAWLGDVIRQYVLSHHILSSSYLICHRYKNADISVAVATPTGLITPIVKDVGAKGLSTISAETKALANKARDGKLAPQEYQVSIVTLVYTSTHPLARVARSRFPISACSISTTLLPSLTLLNPAFLLSVPLNPCWYPLPRKTVVSRRQT